MSSLRKALQKVKSKSQLVTDKTEFKITHNVTEVSKINNIIGERSHPFLKDVKSDPLTTVATVHLHDEIVNQWVTDMDKTNFRGSRILPISIALEYMIAMSLKVNTSSLSTSDRIVSITDYNMVNTLEADDATLFPRHMPTSMLCLIGSDESLGLYGQKSCGLKMVFADANARVVEAGNNIVVPSGSVLNNPEIHFDRFVSCS